MRLRRAAIAETVEQSSKLALTIPEKIGDGNTNERPA